ncbi:YozE family protein [Allofustis seminis]|uniref:YozE family protein n=1 Tax=Allofustis seminis TaxID=166939 RepID=UPI00036F510A|nr:YozE family protein [Allofustis seminis]
MPHSFEKSFYDYLMTERGSKNHLEIAQFAESVFKDTNFPKQSKSYDELSAYLELSTNYLESMLIFDEAWGIYTYQHQVDVL